MKTSPYHTLANKVDTFMALFEKVPINNHKQALPWEYFYYNYFTSMSQTLINSLFQVDYAKAKSHFKIPSKIDTISISFDSNFNLVRNINFSPEKNLHHQSILNYIRKELAYFSCLTPKDTYKQINASLVNAKEQDILLSGVLYHNSLTNQMTFNLVSFTIYLEENLQPVRSKKDSYLDLDISKDLKATLTKDYLQSMLCICEKYTIQPEELENYIMQQYGQDWKMVHRNEKLLKCLELVLFSDMDLHKIAVNHSFDSWHELKSELEAIIDFQKPLIRYTQKSFC
ncbi:hypothetical protein [Myroides sp. LJL119]